MIGGPASQGIMMMVECFLRDMSPLHSPLVALIRAPGPLQYVGGGPPEARGEVTRTPPKGTGGKSRRRAVLAVRPPACRPLSLQSGTQCTCLGDGRAARPPAPRIRPLGVRSVVPFKVINCMHRDFTKWLVMEIQFQVLEPISM
ncbi:hypothetical protein EYF80_039745 [Liparis tanakae]|uniref:Uncharacterized protein n=1 Tax=Liparis tanakae TaxID=230148 RepID=A0A4Z2G942_9TELE|nr:hypothetical protein EYF80_039745 [Liparis tanakae]